MTSIPMRASDDGGVLFDAILTPHRSLSSRGFLVLMSVLVAISFSGALFFLLAGAWPVAGFLALAVVLVYVAFRINYRRARMYETLHLTHAMLTVRRVDHRGGENHWRFNPVWLQVLLNPPPAPAGSLTLRSHGKSLAIGDFLTADERRSLAEALLAALAEARRTPQNG